MTLRSKMAQPGHFAAVIQMISAENYRSKRVRFSALLKTEAIRPRTMLCIYAYSNTTVLCQQYNDDGPLLGTNDWQSCSTTLAIPEECQRIGIGMLLSGTGQVWMNEAAFTLIEQTSEQEKAAKTIVHTAPYNLDIAQGIQGWDLWQNIPFSYLYSVDTRVKASGEQSLYLRSKGEQAEGQVELQQGISVEGYRGQRIRITGLIKAEKVAVWGGLWMIVTGAGGGKIFNSNVQQDRNHDLGIVGSRDWQEYTIIMDIPLKGARIHYGIGLMGQGQIWLDHLTFETVGPEVEVTTRS